MTQTPSSKSTSSGPGGQEALSPWSLQSFRAFLAPCVGRPSRAQLAIRLAVGGVFLVSGLIKFLYENQGPGRFAKIGMPIPAMLAYFVGTVEVVGGVLLLAGLLTRLAAIPLAIDMVVALATTKVPLLYGAGPEPVSAMPKTGFWAFAYQARLDFTMLTACVYLVIVGAGFWSLDAIASRRRWRTSLLGKVRDGRDVELPSVG